MRLRIGEYVLEIEVVLIRRERKYAGYISEEKKTKQPYFGNVCDVCHQTVGSNKGLHIMTCHPEYDFDIARNTSYLAYHCNTCGKVFSGVAVMVKHYQECHPATIKGGIK